MKIKITNRMQYAVSVSPIYAVAARETLEIDTNYIPNELRKAASEGYVYYSIIPENDSEIKKDTAAELPQEEFPRKKRNKSKEIENELARGSTSSDLSQERSE